MKRTFYAPIRVRKDGSIYIDKNNLLKNFFANVVMIFALPALFTGIIILALIDPFNTEARVNENNQIEDRSTNDSRPGFENSTNNTIENMPSASPVMGKITSNFGYRRNPLGGVSTEFHPGLDIGAPIGSAVNAAADGEVVFAGVQHGYGNIVIIKHNDQISTRYAHLSSYSVKLDQSIRKGDQIGKVGITGRSTGPHLHYEVRVDNQPVDPISFLSDKENIDKE